MSFQKMHTSSLSSCSLCTLSLKLEILSRFIDQLDEAASCSCSYIYHPSSYSCFNRYEHFIYLIRDKKIIIIIFIIFDLIIL